jgi:MFS family permease
VNLSSTPALHLWWLAASLAGIAGPMLGFALIWSATAYGVGTVALVSTVAAVPQVLFVLLGGAIGDRHGPRRTLLATTTARILLLALLLVPAMGEP